MHRHGRHVFVVDDEVQITQTLALILTREGFRVSAFNNPLEALESMKTTSPDLLISDVMMPQLSGVELAIRTSLSRPQCKILLFTASTADLLKNARANGHNFRLLRKPVHPSDLLQELNEIREADGDGR
jgi:CheY-like chemotaxis protein